jgi:hypothetical protein
LRVTNLSLTDPAAVLLRRVFAEFRPRRGDAFALVYMSNFTNADGRAVDGFRPGYAAGPWPLDHIGPAWLVAQPQDGPDFHLMPRFKWSAAAHYVVDVASGAYATFTIEPAA